MVNIATFPTHYRAMSWNQIFDFDYSTDLVLSSGSIEEASFKKDLKDWRAVAMRLHSSIQEVLSFSTFFIELFTLQIFKRVALRIKLATTFHKIDTKITDIAYRLWTKTPAPTAAETLQKAHAYFQAHRGTFSIPSLTPKDLKQVEDYFKEKFQIANQGDEPALPHWFHATKTESIAAQIIKDGLLRENDAPAGIGVYVSTTPEERYGPFCIALDTRTIKHFSASYFAPSSMGVYDRLWVRIEGNDVPVDWKGVSHFIVSSDLHEQKLCDLLRNTKLSDRAAVAVTCPIISSKANQVIMECLANTYPAKPNLPPLWKRHEWHPLKWQDPLPATLPVQECTTAFGLI